MKRQGKFIFIANLLVIIFFCSQSKAIDDSNLVLHLAFDEGAGTKAYDSIGINDGTLKGDSNWIDGKIGSYALSFDGSGDYVDMGDLDIIKGSNPFTICAWVYPEIINNSNREILTKSKGKNSIDCQFLLRINFEEKLEGIFSDGLVMGNNLISNNMITLKKWSFVVFSWNGTTNPNSMKLYINGALDCTTKSMCSTIMDIDYPAFIGAFSYAGYPTNFFDGGIDDIRIYNKALSDEEVMQLYMEASAIRVAVDIKPVNCPNPLNLKSRGVLPVAILGSSDFDVNSIDIASIRLAGATPIRSSFEDVAAPASDTNKCACTEAGPDGFIDLVLKFKTTEIVRNIINSFSELNKHDIIQLPLEGFLSNDKPITGSDCVIIVGNVWRELLAEKSDINEDGLVDFIDFSLLAEYWLEEAYLE